LNKSKKKKFDHTLLNGGLSVKLIKENTDEACDYSIRYLWAVGKNVWKRWKKRFFVLVQVYLFTHSNFEWRIV